MAGYRDLYKAGHAPQMVAVPAVTALMIDGAGKPEDSPAFQEAVQALFSLTYTTKFALKAEARAADYKVMSLEGLWWVPGQATLPLADATAWHWTLLMVQPDFVDETVIARSRETLVRRGRSSPSIDRARLATFDEGRAAQLMHVGPYSEETPNIERLLAFIRENDLRPRGAHHEIYLGDPRRADPSRLKTILRQPVAS